MKRFWLVGVGAVLFTCGLAGWFWWSKYQLISPSIKSKLTSTLLLPTLTQANIDPSSVKYDDQLKLLTFTAKIYGVQTVVSEQPTPSSFIDIPQSYQDVVNSMNDYLDFDTAIGTIHLTHPAQLNGKQAAVLNTKGTLLFAKPSQNLTDDDWRRLFNSFQVSQ